eukprot:10188682-Ditylum_brightwellii.AAC.1
MSSSSNPHRDKLTSLLPSTITGGLMPPPPPSSSSSHSNKTKPPPQKSLLGLDKLAAQKRSSSCTEQKQKSKNYRKVEETPSHPGGHQEDGIMKRVMDGTKIGERIVIMINIIDVTGIIMMVVDEGRKMIVVVEEERNLGTKHKRMTHHHIVIIPTNVKVVPIAKTVPIETVIETRVVPHLKDENDDGIIPHPPLHMHQHHFYIPILLLEIMIIQLLNDLIHNKVG